MIIASLIVSRPNISVRSQRSVLPSSELQPGANIKLQQTQATEHTATTDPRPQVTALVFWSCPVNITWVECRVLCTAKPIQFPTTPHTLITRYKFHPCTQNMCSTKMNESYNRVGHPGSTWDAYNVLCSQISLETQAVPQHTFSHKTHASK